MNYELKKYQFWVYIMFDKRAHGTYIGVTNNLERRVCEHKMGLIPGFTQQKHLDKLAYFEEYKYIDKAIAREKALKKWNRAWKYRLIETMNPDWTDLAESMNINIEIVKDEIEKEKIFIKIFFILFTFYCFRIFLFRIYFLLFSYFFFLFRSFSLSFPRRRE